MKITKERFMHAALLVGRLLNFWPSSKSYCSIGKTVEFQLRALRALRGHILSSSRVFVLSRKQLGRPG